MISSFTMVYVTRILTESKHVVQSEYFSLYKSSVRVHEKNVNLLLVYTPLKINF
jgi:hypothetical protein